MIVTLHFVQQPVLDHSGAQVQAARCILILSFYDDDDYTGIDSFCVARLGRLSDIKSCISPATL